MFGPVAVGRALVAGSGAADLAGGDERLEGTEDGPARGVDRRSNRFDGAGGLGYAGKSTENGVAGLILHVAAHTGPLGKGVNDEQVVSERAAVPTGKLRGGGPG